MITIIAIGKLFILGHDACHSALTSSKRLNYWLAQIAFLPAMTTFQGWNKWHNIIHHSFTNLIGNDAWRTLSLCEYKKLSKFEKLKYRFYHSAVGVFFYYFVDIWIYTFCPLFQNPSWFKSSNKPNQNTKLFFIEFTIVIFSILNWFFLIFVLSRFTHQSLTLLILFGILIPFFVWYMSMGFIVYLHHTHPNADWYNDIEKWKNAVTQMTATVHLRFPDWISSLLHHIMEHPAHHINSHIPCYNLKAAQRKLEEIYPDYVVVQNFSWRWYLECTRICKLYDFEKHEWVQFPK